MNSQHLGNDSSLDYLMGEMSPNTKASFERHLKECTECQSRLEQYQDLRHIFASITEEIIDDLQTPVLPWSIEDGKSRLYAALESESGGRTKFDRALSDLFLSWNTLRGRVSILLSQPYLRTTLTVAGSMIMALSLVVSSYHLGAKRGGPKESQVAQQWQRTEEALGAQIGKLQRERDAIQPGLAEREGTIADLRRYLERQQKQIAALETSLLSTERQGKEQTQELSSLRDELVRKQDDQEALLAAGQKQLDALRQTGANDAVRMASLEGQIRQMSQLLGEKDVSLGEQQRLIAKQQEFLDSDRDIRELMGARDLYLAEVYDIGTNGKTKKPYGRVFYTKGKSLIFYGYDLDQQSGLKNASTFQAWGLRGPDRNNALNLGIMYVDNSTNRRWVLRFDDPSALAQINAVFVTVEPNGGSHVPQGKQVLFAYLDEEPNHP